MMMILRNCQIITSLFFFNLNNFFKIKLKNRNEIKLGGWDSPESDSKGQIIAQLNSKIKELETRNAELEILHAKVHFIF